MSKGRIVRADVEEKRKRREIKVGGLKKEIFSVLIEAMLVSFKFILVIVQGGTS